MIKDSSTISLFPEYDERLVGHLGGRCTGNYSCIARNTACQNGVCVCASGYRIFGSTECIPRTIPSYMIRATTNDVLENAVTSEMLASEVDPSASIDSVAVTRYPVMTGPASESSTRREIIVNISGGVCNETTLCLFFSICNNGVCKCPLGSRISETECKFVADGALLTNLIRSTVLSILLYIQLSTS